MNFELGGRLIPSYKTPSGESDGEYLRALVHVGAEVAELGRAPHRAQHPAARQHLGVDRADLVATTLRNYARDHSAVVVCVSHDRAVIDAADDLVMLEKA